MNRTSYGIDSRSYHSPLVSRTLFLILSTLIELLLRRDLYRLARAVVIIVRMASPVTNRMLDAQKEPNCVAVTHERKYYRDGATWIKRSLPPAEWQVNEITGTYFVPRFGRERILNEAACLRYIAEHTDIPVPRVHCCFEDRGAAYLVMDYLEGVQMAELNEEDRTVVQQEVERHRETLRTLRSTQWGGPTGLVSIIDLPSSSLSRWRDSY